MKNLISIFLLLITLLYAGCTRVIEFPGSDVADVLNMHLRLQDSQLKLNPDTLATDRSIGLTYQTTDTLVLFVDSSSDLVINFSAPKANIKGVGIRFGETGTAQFQLVENLKGKINGSFQYRMSIDPSICNKLSKSCHLIKLSSFLLTENNQVSQVTQRNVALICGNCNQQACKDLIYPPCPAEAGKGVFKFGNTTYHGAATCSEKTITITAGNGFTCSLYNLEEGPNTLINYFNASFDESKNPWVKVTAPNGKKYIMKSGTITKRSDYYSFDVVLQDSDKQGSIPLAGNLSCQ